MKTNPRSKRRSVIAIGLKGLSLALLVAVAASCASVNRLREAQGAFSQAAAAENALRFDTKASDAVAGLSSVRSGYASALLSLERISPTDERSLRQDGLWGAALTLKALTQWRLGLFDKALATAQEARESGGDQIYPRDQALMAALPGLIKTDQAYNKISSHAPLADVEALLIGDAGAIANIQTAREQVDKDHPVQLYLLQAQLAAYSNFIMAQERLNNLATVPADHPARAKANAQLKELDRLLKAQNAGTPGEDLVSYWVVLCTLESP